MQILEEQFPDPAGKALLAANGLGGFQSLWELALPLHEAPNRGRSGFSGVFVASLMSPEGVPQRLFVKRQENHTTRSLRHPIAGEPTFSREFRNLQRMRQLGVPTIEPVYFGRAVHEGHQRAVLVSRALDGYLDLDAWLARAERNRVPEVLDAVLAVILRIHRGGFRHGCFYGKHVFVREPAAALELRLLDFEKAHKPLWQRREAQLRDISQLLRHSPALTPSEALYLVDGYCAAQQLGRRGRRVLLRLVERKSAPSDRRDAGQGG